MKIRTARRPLAGQAVVEYALVLALLTIIGIVTLRVLGTQTSNLFDNVQNVMASQGVISTAPAPATQ